MALFMLRIGARNSLGIIEKNLGACSNGFNNINKTGISQNKIATGSSPRPLLLSAQSRTLADRRQQRGRPDADNESDSDSDSDRECRGKHRGESVFWRRKMRTLHGILDVNKDGVVSYDDLVLFCKRFRDVGHLTEEEYEEFKSYMTRTWEEQVGAMTPYNLVTVEQYLEEMHHVLNDKQLKKKVGQFLPYLFRAVNKDKSGFISVDEFKLFFECLGLSSESAAVSFAIIDENQDGQLSMKEFVKLGRDFFLTEDDKKVSKMFWGPLVKK